MHVLVVCVVWHVGIHCLRLQGMEMNLSHSDEDCYVVVRVLWQTSTGVSGKTYAVVFGTCTQNSVIAGLNSLVSEEHTPSMFSV